MSLGKLIKEKIFKQREEILKDSLNEKQCNRCGLYVNIKELEYNAQFPLYDKRKICDVCADKIETRADLEL